MKYLLVLLVVGVVLYLLLGRGRVGTGDATRAKASKRRGGEQAPAKPATMLACVHCGVHLPQAEAVRDGADRAYCSDAHRLAGPRP